MSKVVIEMAATIGGLCRLLDDAECDLQLRGSVVVWKDGEPIRIIGLAPEYPDPPDPDLYDIARDITDETFGKGAWKDPRKPVE